MGEDRRRFDEEPPPVVIRDKRKFDAQGNLRQPDADRAATASGTDAAGGGAGERTAGDSAPAAAQPAGGSMSQDDVDVQVQLLELQTQLDERTADLQRLTAEYANYRKRVDRDRVAVGELATGRVVEAFLPVLDDIERAGAHGDLTGAFKAVADKLIDGLAKLGLEPFGQPGDAFDPSLHEAVLHDESDDVDTPTATTVMRRGYRLGERLVRPAMVGVTAPAAGSSLAGAAAADVGEPASTPDDN